MGDSIPSVPSEKPEFPPLLGLGWHPKTLAEIRALCVDLFPESSTRSGIMDGLAIVVSALEEAGIRGELWIDGSFLTVKYDPEDVDFVLWFRADVYEDGTEAQRRVLDWLSGNLRNELKCDSYCFPVYEADDPLACEGEWWRAYWLRQFGFSRRDEPKGIAVCRLGESDGQSS